MQFKLFSAAALVAGAHAQAMNMSLQSVLGSTPDLSNLTSYVSLFPDILSTLSTAKNITILAPSNEAFAKFLSSPAGSAVTTNDTATIQALLTYHVLNGTYPASTITDTPAFIHTLLNNKAYTNVTGGQVVEAVSMDNKVEIFSGLLANSTVTQADTNFTGGVVHIIDTVLTPPQNISSTAEAAGLTALVGALSSNERLLTSLETASDVTVFAPNNAAFQAIGSALPNLTMQQVTSILGYHVVTGVVGYSSTLMNGTSLKTLGGPNVTITIEDNSVFVNSAKVVTPDVLVANGVVHVIDNVLNPNATTATPQPTASTQSVAFSGASSATEVPFTSGVPTPTSAIGGGAGGTSSMGGTASASAAMTSTSGAAMPMRTGAMGAAALFAGAGVWWNA